MEQPELAAAVRSLLTREPVLTLATLGPDGPWAADVYFAPAGDRLVFWSSPSARHSRHLAANPRTAATIHPACRDWHDIRGIQMQGRTRMLLDTVDIERARIAYVGKFPFAAELLSNGLPDRDDALAQDGAGARSTTGGSPVETAVPWIFEPDRIEYLDNRLGFGSRFALDLSTAALSALPAPG